MKPRFDLRILSVVFLLIPMLALAQPINNKEWQSATISSGEITITCRDLLLPFEVGHLLSEPNPIVSGTGEMTQTLQSGHEIKVALQPESGTADDLTTISGCSVDGTELWLATQDTDDIITVVHNAGTLELVPLDDVTSDIILGDPNTILKLVRKGGKWIQLDSIGGGGSITGLNVAHQIQPEITGSDETTPFTAGNGTQKGQIYGSATLGTVWKSIPDGDFSIMIPVDKKWCWYDVEAADAPIMCIDPDGATTRDIYTFPSLAYQPYRYIYFPAGAMSIGGGCTVPANEQLITNGPKADTITCTDNDADTVYFDALMPLNWTGGSILAVLDTVSYTNQNNLVLQMHLSGRCGLGAHLTSGEQIMSVTFGNATNDEQISLPSNSISLNGTCSGGSKTYFQAQVHASGTTVSMANARILGIGIFYRVDSMSN